MKTSLRLIVTVLGSAILCLSTVRVEAQFSYIARNGTITITGYTGTGGDVVIPRTINGSLVTAIGDRAFYANPRLTSIRITNSVTTIGNCAFEYCVNLTNVTVRDNLTTIGQYAFYNTSLHSITVPNSVTSIGEGAFGLCTNLTSITLSDGLTSIADYTFERCFGLTSIGVPESVSTIGFAAFRKAGLTSVLIPNGVRYIGWKAFEECVNLAAITVTPLNLSYSSLDGVLFDKSQSLLIQFPNGKTGSYYNIPASVIVVGDSAFISCGKLTSVTIGNSVTDIGHYAFYNCTGLTNVTMGNSVTNLGQNAFYKCTRLTSVTIPDSVTSIGSYAFEYCTSLTSILIPSNVTSIGSYAFGHCTNLTSVAIPDSVTILSSFTFLYCSGLTNVTIPNSLNYVGYAAFGDCTNLRGLYFQGNAPSEADPFGGSTNLTVYYLPGTTGWGTAFGQRPTAPWLLPYPVILTTAPNFGIQTNAFGFRISWATNAFVVVEASTTLDSPVWSPVSTNTLTDGWCYFSDAEWTTYPARFYGVRQW